MSLQYPAFDSFGYIPRNGIAVSRGSSVFSFLRNYAVFYSSRGILHSHQQCTRVQIFPYPEKGMTTTLSLLPGKFHGQRSLVGCKESDLIEQLTLSHPEYINSYNSKTTKNLIKKSAKDLHTHFSKIYKCPTST